MSRNEYQAKVLSSSIFFTPEDFKMLSKLRIIQKNLVHVQGFPDSLADKTLLSQREYFGQFGKINKIVVVSKEDEVSKKKSNSAYITFSSKEEAAYAVLAIDSIMLEGHIVRAFFGTSKYCIHFLNNVECYNKDKCMFLHSIANENDILGTGSKFGYSEHIKLAKEIINFNSIKTKNTIMNMVIPFRTILPNIKSIYTKEGNSDSNTNNKSMNNNNSNSNNISNNNIIINETDINNIMNNKNNNTVTKHKNINSTNKNQAKSCNNNNIFKYKNQSRFFNNEPKHNNKFIRVNNNINEDNNSNNNIPDTLLNLIDELFVRMPFFKQFDKFYSLKNYELGYCKSKYQNINDSWFDFILNNTN